MSHRGRVIGRKKTFLISVWGWLVLVATSIQAATQATPPFAASSPGLAQHSVGYAVQGSCDSCHQSQAEAWKDSDHAWSLRDATAENVLGDFADTEFVDGKVIARFFRRGDRFFVNTEGEDGQNADFEIRYTFGYSPLQQYLVEFPGGRLQSLTIAWDNRRKEQGGQRWYSLYPGQHFNTSDALHWTGRYQNWNSMCADCHSTNLQKNYDDKSDTFSTTWHEQSVGCQSCHGPGQAHVDWAVQQNRGGLPKMSGRSVKAVGLEVDLKAMQSSDLVEQCARCHSRRQILGVGPQPGKPLLDMGLPSLLTPDLYHADGQVQGENYVYGSFTQSRMHSVGVSCSDCHDMHSTRVKQKGNGLCLQCHNSRPPVQKFPQLKAKNYDSPAHHHHEPGSAGAQCVNCHMPTRTYMGVDARRDHAIRIPRPDLSEAVRSPDACTGCHNGKSAQWAVDAIDSWYDQPQRRAHYGEIFAAARAGQAQVLGPLLKLINDLSQPTIVRATAVTQLNELIGPDLSTLEQALRDNSGLVRAYAASSFDGVPDKERIRLLLPMLDDTLLAVRDEALRNLADIPLRRIPKEKQASVEQALKNYEKRLRENSDLPANRLNLAVLLERQQHPVEAREQYKMALKLDPYFSPARINLVSLLNRMESPDAAIKVLRDGLALEAMPIADHGQLAYMLALLLVQQGRPDEGLHWLDEAAQSEPQNARIRYNQGLLLMQLRRMSDAQRALEAGVEIAPNDTDLLYSLMYLHASNGRRAEALKYIERLEQVAPGDRRVANAKRQLLGSP